MIASFIPCLPGHRNGAASGLSLKLRMQNAKCSISSVYPRLTFRHRQRRPLSWSQACAGAQYGLAITPFDCIEPLVDSSFGGAGRLLVEHGFELLFHDQRSAATEDGFSVGLASIGAD